MCWFRIIERLKFEWQAKNAHALHSPFAFSFYNVVKRDSKRSKSSALRIKNFSKKESQVIGAIFQNLEIKNILIVSNFEQDKSFWSNDILAESEVSFTKNISKFPDKASEFDLIIFHNLLLISTEDFIKNLHPIISNQSAVIIPHIYASKESIIRWKSLIKNIGVRVSMDLFFIGILFFRKESTKQNFRLRF